MINLIPKEEKKKMQRKAYARVILLAFIVLDVCTLVALLTLLPAYVYSVERLTAAKEKLSIQDSQPVPTFDTQALATIKDLNDKLSLVENAEKNNFSVSARVISDIVVQKTPDIKITKIYYSVDPTQGQTVNITGTAPSREVLLAFREVLQSDATFKSVDLPISNFVKGSNIQFSLSLIPS